MALHGLHARGLAPNGNSMKRISHTLRVLRTFSKARTRKVWVIAERIAFDVEKHNDALVIIADRAEQLAQEKGCIVAIFQGRCKTGEAASI